MAPVTPGQASVHATAKLTYKSAHGAPPVTNTYSITLKGKKKRH